MFNATSARSFSALLAFALVMALSAGAASAEDSASRFLDRDAITALALADDAEARAAAEQALSDATDAVTDATTALTDAQTALQDAIDAGADQADIDALQLVVDSKDGDLVLAQGEQGSAQGALDAFVAEDQAAADAIAALSDEQVIAFNRSVNDTQHNGRQLNLDADHLQMIVDGNYSGRQIQSLTKALEEEAKFLAFAERANDRYDATGNDKFLDQAARFEGRSESQKHKFLAKIDRFDSQAAARDARDASRDARATARDAARDAASEARDAARTARETARDAARDARDTARDAARAARDAARDARKG